MKQMLQICCKNNNIYKEFPIGSSLLDIYYGFNPVSYTHLTLPTILLV